MLFGPHYGCLLLQEGVTGSERELEVSASFTFQREGRVGEAALQQWRKERLRKEKCDVDFTQTSLYEGIQEWARQHHSDERAASKSSRVTIHNGQIVQGSQSRPHRFCMDWTLADAPAQRRC